MKVFLGRRLYSLMLLSALFLIQEVSLASASSRDVSGITRLEAEDNDGSKEIGYDPSQDEDGSRSAGYINPGDYIEWNIYIPETQIYTIASRSAVANPTSIEILIDGELSDRIDLTSTGGWFDWETFESKGLLLEKGVHTLRAYFPTQGHNLNWIELKPSVARNILENSRLEGEDNDGSKGIAYEPSQDVDGSQSVGGINPGEHIEWNIYIPETQIYTIASRSAVANPTSIEILIDGELSDRIDLVSTGGWFDWETFESKGLLLEKGVHTLRAYFPTQGHNLNWIELKPSVARNILENSRLEGEDNDGSKGIAYEPSQDVDGSQSVGGINPGEHIEWNIYIPETQIYTIASRSAVANPTSIEILIDGELSDRIDLASTGGWFTWETFESKGLLLEKGVHTLRTYFPTQGHNLNWIELLSNDSGQVSILPNNVKKIDANAYATECAIGDCVQAPWGVTVNNGGKYTRELFDVTAGPVEIYIRVASESGERSMGLYVNGVKVDVITADANTAPRGYGQLIGPISVNLTNGDNVIELRGSEGGGTLDILALETRKFEIIHSEKNPKLGQSYSFSIDVNSELQGWILEDVGIYGHPEYTSEETAFMTQFSHPDSYKYCVNNKSKILRFLGYFHPPASGNYEFDLAADDYAQLYIVGEGVNSNQTVNFTSKKMIAEVKSWSKAMDFKTSDASRSNAIYLDAEKKYYMDIRHEQGGGSGHFSVGIKMPGDTAFSLMNTEHFSSALCTGEVPCLQSSGPTGLISLQQMDKGSFPDLNTLPEPYEKYENSSSLLNANIDGSVSFFPSNIGWHDLYFKAVESEGDSTALVKKRIYVEEKLGDVIAEGLPGWTIRNTTTESTVVYGDSCGEQGDGCISMTSNEFDKDIYISRSLKLQPHAAYKVSARVKVTGMEYFEGKAGASGSTAVTRPYIASKDYSRVAVKNSVSWTSWQDIETDFVVPTSGDAYIKLGLGKAKSKMEIDNIRIEKLESSEVTVFNTENMVFNINNITLTRFMNVNGYDLEEAEKMAFRHFNKVSKLVGEMDELSGRRHLQCHKEAQWASTRYVLSYGGLAGNPLQEKVPTEYKLKNVWNSDDVIDGVYTHELAHNFDYEPWLYGNHLVRLLEVYPLVDLGYKKHFTKTLAQQAADPSGGAYGIQTTDDFRYFEELVRHPLNAEGCYNLDYFLEKPLKYTDQYGWGPIKEFMHATWKPGAYPWLSNKAENIGLNYMRMWADILHLKPQVDLVGPLSDSVSEKGRLVALHETWSEAVRADSRWLDLHNTDEQKSFNMLANAMKTTGQNALVSAAGCASDDVGCNDIEPGLQTLNLQRVRVESGSDTNNLELYRGLAGTSLGSGLNLLCTEQGAVTGLLAHAPSNLKFDLGGAWQNFTVTAGMMIGYTGSVKAKIYLDGVLKKETGVITKDVFEKINIKVAGGELLELKFDSDGSTSSDLSIWIDPILTRIDEDEDGA